MSDFIQLSGFYADNSFGRRGEKASLEFWNFYSRLQTRKAEIQDTATEMYAYDVQKNKNLKTIF